MSVAENNLVLDHIDTIDKAVTNLSLRGYVVVKATIRNVDEAPMIEIDRPVADIDATINKEKGIGYVELFDSRIYWKLQTD